MRRWTSFLLFAVAVPASQPAPTMAQHPKTPASQAGAGAVSTAVERRAGAAFTTARSGGTLSLHAFLEQMPKGADLHIHLAGAVYAETFLKNAVADHLCLDPVNRSFVKSVGLTRSIPPQPVCAEGMLPASAAFSNQKLYDSLVDAFSMRAFVPSSGVSGHDQFFATFGHFDGLDSSHSGEWLDELATRAAAQNEQYLEVMITPSRAKARSLAAQFGWPAPAAYTSPAATSEAPAPDGASPVELAALRQKLLEGGLRDDVAADRQQLDGYLDRRNQIEQCGEVHAAPACSVQIRILYQVLRAAPPEQVFAQTLLAFEVASADPNVVGLNFVQPEDAYLAMSEYHRQMLMLDYLHSVYPAVHITLHAGELSGGMVPPAGLRFHIREAVERGHAERIGHGVDVMTETDPQLLIRELADRHVMVEVNLTSNDVILGVSTNRHSFPAYLAGHVPVALSTDDEGVSRIDLTHEYTRAVLEFGLTYLDLKRMARTSIEHAFLPGPSLWARPDNFAVVVAPCAAQPVGAEAPRAACLEFLKQSARATQQWELEHRFQHFESGLH